MSKLWRIDTEVKDLLENNTWDFRSAWNKLRFFRYVIVRLASVITGTSKMWVRERMAEKSAGIFFDPACKEILYFPEMIF